jgi:hypothetical protein
LEEERKKKKKPDSTHSFNSCNKPLTPQKNGATTQEQRQKKNKIWKL